MKIEKYRTGGLIVRGIEGIVESYYICNDNIESYFNSLWKSLIVVRYVSNFLIKFFQYQKRSYVGSKG